MESAKSSTPKKAPQGKHNKKNIKFKPPSQAHSQNVNQKGSDESKAGTHLNPSDILTNENCTSSKVASNNIVGDQVRNVPNEKTEHVNISGDMNSCKSKQDVLLAALEKPLINKNKNEVLNQNLIKNSHLGNANPRVHEETHQRSNQMVDGNSSKGKDLKNQKQLQNLDQDTVMDVKNESVKQKNSDTELNTPGAEADKKDAKTEKELRKLEWQKKLAEQNLKNKGKEPEGSSKAELRAKRREQQEAQRLAKVAAQEKTPESKKPPKSTGVKDTSKLKQTNPEVPKQVVGKVPNVEHHKTPSKAVMKKSTLCNILGHLYIENLKTSENDMLVNFNYVHPKFVKLGAQMSSRTIVGSNARCLAFLSAVIDLVRDLDTPQKQEFSRYLESVLQKSVDYLQSCRPLAVCMKNALKYFKSHLTQMNISHSEKEKKLELEEIIQNYIKDEIETADKSIILQANDKIQQNDIILTIGCSSVVEKILRHAHETKKKFEVIVVDSRPLLEGREMVRRLVLAGIKCKYVLMNALSYVMSTVSLVFVGAHALLSNGYIMSRIGTAQVALVAKTFNKPVIVCSEAYKLSDIVQFDAFVYNELGDPNDLANVSDTKGSVLSSHKTTNKLSIINPLYDLTPPDFIAVVITELGSFHSKSVPSIRRMKPTKLL